MPRVEPGKGLRLAILSGAVALLVGVVGACAGDDDESASQALQQPAAPQQPAAAEAAADPSVPAAATGTTATTEVPNVVAPQALSAVARAQFEAFPEDGGPQYGGVLRVAEGDPTHLSFLENVPATVGEPGGLVHNQLLVWDFQKMYSRETYTVAPGIAKSWDISADGTVWTFPLRDDVLWHDGNPFTCADAKATYDFYLDPGDYGPPGRNYVGPYVATTQCTDPYTLVLTLNAPTGSLLENLAYQWTFLIPKHKLDQEGVEWFRTNMIGTGPFIWSSDQWERGIRWNVTRNPNYWEDGLPYLDGVTAFALADVGSNIAAFQTKRIDVTSSGSPTQQRDLIARGAGKVQQVQVASAGHSYILYNVRKPPFDDPKVRQAMYFWLDRQEFLDKAADGKGYIKEWLNPSWNGGYGTSYEDLVKNNLAYNPDKTEARKKAMELLAEAGYTDLGAVKIDVLSRYTSGGALEANQILTAQLKQMGWDAELRAMERLAGVQALQSGDYQIAYYGGHAGLPLPDATLNRNLGASGQRNYTGYSDPVYEKLLAAFNTTADPVKRRQVLEQLDQHLQQGTYSLHVMVWARQDGLQWDYVNGYEWLRGCCAHPHWRVWLDPDAPGKN